jgi:hypothetical protein
MAETKYNEPSVHTDNIGNPKLNLTEIFGGPLSNYIGDNVGGIFN